MSEATHSNDLPKIFNRFHRVELTKAGTRCGLAIVKTEPELHGSEHKIESKKGKGTTFTFSLSTYTKAQLYNQKNNSWSLTPYKTRELPFNETHLSP